MAAPILSLGILLISAAAAAGDPESPAPTPVETFAPPVAVSLNEPRYPEKRRRLGEEGWVQLTFMVSPEGTPYDIAVVYSSGDPSFEAAAIDAVETWAFEPARLADVPIDAGMNYMIRFALSDNAGASTAFVKTFRKLMRSIEAGDRAAADSELADLQGRERNLYEEASLNLAVYDYLARWGTAEQQYPPLRRATATDDGQGFLPDDLLTPLLKRRLALELKLNRFADARDTGSLVLEREQDPDVRASIDSALARVDALAASDQPIPVTGRIDDSSHYFHRLLRRRFQFEHVDGDIAELRLHCDRDYVGFRFDPELAYTLADSLGQCGLRVIGTPGTTFTLVEL